MKKVSSLLVVFAVLLFLAAPAFSVVQFNIGPEFNLFSDARIVGSLTSAGFSFDVGPVTTEYLIEQGNLTFSDVLNSTNNFLVVGRVDAFRISREITTVVGLPVLVGIEFGSVMTTGQAGTQAAPAGISQIVPLIGLLGSVAYESKTDKGVITSVVLNIGYRIIDVRDTAVPGGFTAGGKNFTDFNSFVTGLRFGIKF